MRQRLTSAIGLTGLIFLGACSSPSTEPVGVQELRTAPPTTEPLATTTTPATTAASTTIPATTISEATTLPASLKSEDELKIEYVIGEFNRVDWNEKVNRTFDIKVYDGLIEGRKLENAVQALQKRKLSTRYILPGTILETVVIETTITGDTAVSTSCERNDLQVWEGNGTPDKSDDVLADGTLLVAKLQHELRRRGDSWVITRTIDAEGDCSSAF